ncbi:MAG: TetR/AcrR family transcriptional regulator [Burkholderiales bacterium]|jgi:TetR/AcrR family transcriptional regulator, transcriptional repressor for nem operon|nr:TetR/AcrR family transcriptional regulator [Burkholderiales bacterium]
MARPREFEPDAALERAMQAFWAKGYKATSLDDLCTATGLSRSSLYAAFGGKRALLHQSLARYEEEAVTRINAALAKPLPIREAIAGFVGELIDRIVAGPGRAGCFIGNCAAELSGQDRATAARVRQSLARIEGIFCEALARAQSRGEIGADADVASLARFLVSGIQGLRLVGKANPDRAALTDIAAVMLRCFDS